MESRKALVLGASGFLGSTLCEYLCSLGESVRGFDRVAAPDSPGLSCVDWVQGDFSCAEDIDKALAGCDRIYHLLYSTIPSTSNADPAADCSENVLGTIRLLELAKHRGIKKIVFISSGGTVYGVPRMTPIKESAPVLPICAYGISKLAIEKYLHLYHVMHGIDYCVLRVSNPYGERQRIVGAQGAVGVFLGKVLSGNPIEIWGDGKVVRDYIYAADVIRALHMSMAYSGEERVFNIGSGVGVSLNELVSQIEGVLGTRVRCIYKHSRPVDVPVNVLDIRLAKEVLGWEPSVSLGEGIRRVYEYHCSSRVLKGLGTNRP